MHPRTSYRALKINPDGKLIKLSALRTRAVGNIGGGEMTIKSLPSVSTLLSGVSGF